MEIKLQKQVQPNGCMSACLAMLLGRHVNDVSAEFNTKYHTLEVEPVAYAHAQGLTLEYPEQGPLSDILFPDFIYIAVVPSLNTPGMLHAIIVDVRDSNNVKVYDPATGQQYMSPTEYWGEPGTTKLVSWIVKYKVVL